MKKVLSICFLFLVTVSFAQNLCISKNSADYLPPVIVKK